MDTDNERNLTHLFLGLFVLTAATLCGILLFYPTQDYDQPGLVIGPAYPSQAEAAPEPTPTTPWIAQVALIYAQAEASHRQTQDAVTVMVVQSEIESRKRWEVTWAAFPWMVIILGSVAVAGAVGVRVVRELREG